MNYRRVATASPSLKVADVAYNKEQILAMALEAADRQVEVMVFPELAITGATCGDLFNQELLRDKAQQAVLELAEELPEEMLTVVGAPLVIRGDLYDAAVCYYGGRIMDVFLKTYPANSGDAYEKRWFASSLDLHDSVAVIGGIPVPVNQLMELGVPGEDSLLVGVEIGSELFSPLSPGSRQALAGADLILCPAAQAQLVGSQAKRKAALSAQSSRVHAAYAYAGAGPDESSTDAAFGGDCYIFEDGQLLTEGPLFHRDGVAIVADVDVERLRQERVKDPNFSVYSEEVFYEIIPLDEVVWDAPFPWMGDVDEPLGEEEMADIAREAKGEELLRSEDPHPFLPAEDADVAASCDEILKIQAMGLVRRMEHIHCEKAVIGVSGGLDSTLALLATCRAMDILELPHENIHAITMPGLGTSETTHSIADELMDVLSVTKKEISIAEAAALHLKDIGHDEASFDSSYENAQARERTQVLMDYANMIGGIVVGTGDLSELALGWCTFNGDHMAMYGVNAGIPKTLVRYLVKGTGTLLGGKAEEVLSEVAGIPISPELLPTDASGGIAQKTEDLVGPYELHDFFLYHTLRYGEDPAKIFKLARMAFCADEIGAEGFDAAAKANMNGAGVYDAETIKKWLVNFYRRFFMSQFKRSCLPDGPKVLDVSLSPRSDFRMPSDAAADLWIKEAESL